MEDESMKFLFLVVVTCIITGSIIAVDAVRIVDDYGIVTSKKCQIMIKNNITSDCPTNEQLLELFPDTSPRQYVGDFKIIDNIVQREPMKVRIDNCWHFLNSLAWTQSKTVWIDPPGCMQPYMKMITIESNFNQYPIIGITQQVTNNTILMGNERYVNSGCTESIINAKDWIFLTGDTLRFLNHGCDPAFTSFDHIKKFTFEKSNQDIVTSNKYKLDEFFKNAKEKYKVSHIGSNDMNENKSVIEDEDE